MSQIHHFTTCTGKYGVHSHACGLQLQSHGPCGEGLTHKTISDTEWPTTNEQSHFRTSTLGKGRGHSIFSVLPVH